MRRILLFVYGTLLSGEKSHHLLDGSESAGRARTAPAFVLFDFGEYPAMAHGGTTAVVGELYRIEPEIRSRLDDFEGHPHTYRRSRIALAGGRVAQAYLVARPTPERYLVIPHGDWRAWRARDIKT